MRRDRASALLLVVGVAGCFGAATACGRLTGLDSLSFDLTDGGGGAGNRSTTGSSTGSSSTGGQMCKTAAECTTTVPPGPCASLGMVTCAAGVCGVTYKVGRAPSQQYGTCRQNVCDATGKMTSVADDTNVFTSGNDCMLYACSSGLLNPTVTQGTMCVLDGGPPSPPMGFCEPDQDPTNPGLEVCSQCDPSPPSMCPMGTMCDHGTCKVAHCTNGTKDANETDVDCGGMECFPCGTGKACNNHSDCFSQQCTAGKCLAPTCTDGFQNGTETDTDCGGGTCSPCADGLICLLPSDCASGVCLPQMPTTYPNRCAAPTCTDGVKNGLETGVDCGGPDVEGGVSCPPCAP